MGIIPGEVAVSWAKIIRKYNWPDTLEKDIQKACEEYARNLSDYKAMQLAEKDAEIERLKKAVSDAQQESFFVREYLDEARDWFRQIMEEAEDCPNTIEEWRDGLCSGSVGVVVNFCKAAMSEIPEGGDVVFLVRQRIEDADVWQSPRGRGGEIMEWVELKKQKPNAKTDVIVFAPNGKNQIKNVIKQSYFMAGEFYAGDYANCIDGVTHWMPMPGVPVDTAKALAGVEE